MVLIVLHKDIQNHIFKLLYKDLYIYISSIDKVVHNLQGNASFQSKIGTFSSIFFFYRRNRYIYIFLQ